MEPHGRRSWSWRLPVAPLVQLLPAWSWRLPRAVLGLGAGNLLGEPLPDLLDVERALGILALPDIGTDGVVGIEQHRRNGARVDLGLHTGTDDRKAGLRAGRVARRRFRVFPRADEIFDAGRDGERGQGHRGERVWQVDARRLGRLLGAGVRQDPGRKRRQRHVVRVARCLPGVAPAGAVRTGRRDHLLPGQLQVQARRQLAPGQVLLAGKVVMLPTAATEDEGGLGQGAMMMQEVLQGHIAPVARVDIEDRQAGAVAGQDAEVRVRPLGPPGREGGRSGAARRAPVVQAGVLATVLATRAAFGTGTGAGRHVMQRDHMPAPSCIGESGIEQGVRLGCRHGRPPSCCRRD